MPLTVRQSLILRYLGTCKSATTGNVAKSLLMNRDDAQNALRGLTSRGLASVDHGTFPASYSITDIGSAVLAAANEREQ
jgi:DNA-binding MarR family transcriptional regulator